MALNRFDQYLLGSIPKFFSVGIDLDMFDRPKDEFTAFFDNIFEVFYTLYSSPLVSVAAIRGHAPAGGTVLALSCNYRVAVRRKVPRYSDAHAIGRARPSTSLG